MFMILLLPNTSDCSFGCTSMEFVSPFRGRYCPTEGRVIADLSWHQCKLFCLQTARCEAINHNFSFNICTHITAPCPEAISHLEMAYILFTGRQPHQCIEWIPQDNAYPVGDRLMAASVRRSTIRRYTIRMQKNGSDYIGHLRAGYDSCLARDDQGAFRSDSGYPCQYLRISEGCTVFYVAYKLGSPLPLNAVIGGYTAEGASLYIGRPSGSTITGYYIQGTNILINEKGIYIENVEILVSL